MHTNRLLGFCRCREQTNDANFVHMFVGLARFCLVA